MAMFICETCDEAIDIDGADGRHDEICDCGAKLTPADQTAEAEAERRADRFRLHETFRGG